VTTAGPVDGGAASPDPSALRERRLRAAYWIVMAQGTVIVGLVAAFAAYLVLRRPSLSSEGLLLDADVRARAMQELVEQGAGHNDSFPDPDVGRILLPSVDRRLPSGAGLLTNPYGMRERAYALPKPAGLTRVVLLGDSFIFGLGITIPDRACSFLEPWLKQRSRPGSEIECLQLGVSSWNIVAECAYLRRQLSELRPDLVVQLVVPNDLNDSSAVRGFGGAATFGDRHRERADGMVSGDHFRKIGFPNVPARPLVYGLDYESRSRYAEAAEHIRRLASAVTAAGGRYMLLVKWSQLVGGARDHLAAALPGVEVLYLPHAFSQAREHILSESNLHWNRAGNEAVARFLYGWLHKQDVLPALGPGAWDEATTLYERVRAEGDLEAARAPSGEAMAARPPLGSVLDFSQFKKMAPERAAQIHGGIDQEALAAPYASVVLARAEANGVVVAGTALPRPEIDGAELTVYTDDEPVGALRLQAGRDFEVRAALPPAVRARPFFSVRLRTTDYVYAGPERRNCVALRLRQIAAVP
jgi:hypothetical protein